MKTLSGTSLTSEMRWDRQIMEDTLPLGLVTLSRDKGMLMLNHIHCTRSKYSNAFEYIF